MGKKTITQVLKAEQVDSLPSPLVETLLVLQGHLQHLQRLQRHLQEAHVDFQVGSEISFTRLLSLSFMPHSSCRWGRVGFTAVCLSNMVQHTGAKCLDSRQVVNPSQRWASWRTLGNPVVRSSTRIEERGFLCVQRGLFSTPGEGPAQPWRRWADPWFGG